MSYADLAPSIARSSAARAVGNAVEANPLALLIPCHRVIRQNGIAGPYRWSTAKKQAILVWEAARKHYCGAS